MTEFNFSKKTEEISWLVANFLPIGHLSIVLAQAGVGKSLFVEELAIHTIYGVPFCDFDILEGDVVIFDQDTPMNVLDRRLIQMSSAMETERKYKLFVESMKGYSLSDNTLISAIKDYPTARLIIIDCLHTFCGRLNSNYTSDMSILAKLKRECLNKHNTILINHHISQKKETTIDTLMQGDTNTLAMGSSAIIQQADTYYIVGATAVEGRTDRIYIRPVSKHVSIKSKPLVIRMTASENGTGETARFDGYYEPDLEQIEEDIIILFREQQKDRTVKEIYEDMGHKHGEKAVRKALITLENKGRLQMSRYKSNLFKYKMPIILQ